MTFAWKINYQILLIYNHNIFKTIRPLALYFFSSCSEYKILKRIQNLCIKIIYFFTWLCLRFLNFKLISCIKFRFAINLAVSCINLWSPFGQCRIFNQLRIVTESTNFGYLFLLLIILIHLLICFFIFHFLNVSFQANSWHNRKLSSLRCAHLRPICNLIIWVCGVVFFFLICPYPNKIILGLKFIKTYFISTTMTNLLAALSKFTLSWH